MKTMPVSIWRAIRFAIVAWLFFDRDVDPLHISSFPPHRKEATDHV
jgi:hypothetical protein